jgi:glucose-1-phosphate cytidylyltransferase
MKVVLFCGGLGMRLREYDANIPKPMVPIGYRPILWHVMKYYAHFGHADFILCLGYRGDVIKNYFRTYDECVSNDFVLSDGGRRVELLRSDITDWRITFVDTGVNASVGERLQAVAPHLAAEEEFLASYSDGLTDLPLPAAVEHFRRHGATASFLSVTPHLSYHFVGTRNGGQVTSLRDVGQTGLRINGGFFVFRREIFDYLRRGEDLVMGAFQQLLADNRLLAYRYDGFWESMDTFKDKQRLDDMYARGDAPWEVWARATPAVHVPEARAPLALGVRRRPAVRSP